jgi:glycosyltransferase involved in cell wall biosynthesis
MSSTTRLRVAYAIKSMITGGSQTHLLQVLRFLDRRRFDPLLYCLTGEGELLDAVRHLDVPVIAPAARASFRAGGLARRVAATSRSLRGEQIQIVHNYLLRANLVGSLSARLAGVPVVLCSKRGCHERRGFALTSARIGNALADCVTANSNAVRDFVHANEACPREKITVIPSAIDTDRFRPLPSAPFKTRLGIPEDRLVVGSVTRMRVRKGVEEFVRAMAMVCAGNPAAHAVIAGDVELQGPMAALVRSLGLEERLTLLGRRRDIPEVLSAFDVFVLSSHGEGMSNAILEAMAMQRAVVATSVGGNRESVRHGESGLLVPAKDPAALAQAIEELLGQPARCAEMGRRGRRIVEERFSARAMVREMEALYDKLAAARGVKQSWPVESTA